MKEITIKVDELNQLVQEGGKFLFRKEAEDSLIKLLEWQERIESMIKEVKLAIEKAGLSISKDFKGVIGSKVKAIYRAYGERYEYDKSKTSELGEFLKTITFHKVDSDRVDLHFEKTGKIPDGIRLKDRQPVISLSLVKPSLEEENK